MAKPRKPKKTLNTSSEREFTRWWDLGGDEVAAGVEERARQLWDADSHRRLEAEKNLSRWGLTLSGLYADTTVGVKDAMRVNLTKSLTETITAKIGKNRPRPLVLTDDGKFANKQKAKKLQKFLDAVYQATDVYMLAPQLFRNSMLMGTGVLGVFGNAYQARFELENVFPLEILVDNLEAARGEKYVRNLIRVFPCDKDQLQELYPAAAKAIEGAPIFGVDREMPTSVLTGGSNRDLRTCMVTGAWRKQGYTAKGQPIPGRYVLVCHGEVLEDEEYTDDFFPFLFHHWTAPVRGFWGDSAIAEIRGLEREVNVNLQRGQDALRRGGMPIVFAPATAEVKVPKLTNEPMIVVNYEGQIAPQVQVGQAAHPQILDQPAILMRMAANQLGTNELQTSASKPAGIESGRALEQLSEEHAVRFDTVSKAFEDVLSKGLAAQFVRVAKAMDTTLRADGLPGLRLRSTYKREYIDLKWSEVELGPDELFLQTWPVSVLPHTPSGRTAEIERWQGNKWITDDQAKTLLDFPDLESVASVSRADFELLEWQLSEMLDEGRQVVPERRQNLDQARSYGTHMKLKAQREGYPEEHIALLEDFLAVLDDLLMPTPVEAGADPSMPPLDPNAVPPALPGDPGALGMGATAPIADPMLAGAGTAPPMM